MKTNKHLSPLLYKGKKITKEDLIYELKLYKLKNLKNSSFGFNVDNSIARFNANIHKELNSCLFYFGNRDATIFDIIEAVKKDKCTEKERKIFNRIFSNFWNRIFFTALYQEMDWKAKSVYFKLEY